MAKGTGRGERYCGSPIRHGVLLSPRPQRRAPRESENQIAKRMYHMCTVGVVGDVRVRTFTKLSLMATGQRVKTASTATNTASGGPNPRERERERETKRGEETETGGACNTFGPCCRLAAVASQAQLLPTDKRCEFPTCIPKREDARVNKLHHMLVDKKIMYTKMFFTFAFTSTYL